MPIHQLIPPPLPAHKVSLLLSYLSALDHPLPSYLLSAPLRQRHHFLDLGRSFDTPEDIAAYLCWPNSTSAQESLRVVNILSELRFLSTLNSLPNYSTKYFHDGDALYAHAHIPVDAPDASDGGLRLIFLWEPPSDGSSMQKYSTDQAFADQWKYHDTKLMPFTESSFDFPEEALRPSGSLACHIAAHQSSGSNTSPRQCFKSEDNYWNSHGESALDDVEESIGSNGLAVVQRGDEADTEDAYWAQYSSAFETAGLERLSPPPQKNHIPSNSNGPVTHTELTSISRELLPVALERRLSALSLERDVNSEPSPSLLTISTETASLAGQAGSDESNMVQGFLTRVESRAVSENLVASPEPRRAHGPPAKLQQDDSDDEAFSETIKGLYRLWVSTRKRRFETGITDEKQNFISKVKNAIQGI